MNKKGIFGIEKLGSILLIIIVVILILLGGSQLLWKSAQSGVKTLDSWFGLGLFKEEKDLTDLNNLAKTSFDFLKKDLDSCKKTKNNDCKCLGTKGFSEFSNGIHAIEVLDDKLRLILIKDNNQVTMTQTDVGTPKCYTTLNSYKSLENPSIILVNEETILKDKKNNEISFEKSNFRVFYKNNKNEICWMTKDINQGKLGFCQI